MKRLLLLAIAVIVYGTLYPWHFVVPDVPEGPVAKLLHSWPVHWNRFAARDAAVNLTVYFPLGFLAYLAAARRWGRTRALAASAALAMGLSTSLELLQFFVPPRDTSLFDIACNSVGGLAGAGVAALFEVRWTAMLRARSNRPRIGWLALLSCWVGHQLYPFIPVFSRTRLRAGWGMVLHSGLAESQVLTSAAEWFAAALLLQALFGRLRAHWLAAAMLCLPLRWMVVSRTVSPSETAGAAAALLLWIVLAEKARLRVGVVLLAAAIVILELAPFHFSAGESSFSWVPFASTLAAQRDQAVIVICRKAFDYGAMVWLLQRAGIPLWRSGAAVTAALAVLEAAQARLPGRTPETTDAALALLMTLVLWLGDFQPRRGLLT
jgi:VanZ family protein